MAGAALLLLTVFLVLRLALRPKALLPEAPVSGLAGLARFDPPAWAPLPDTGQDPELQAAMVAARDKYQAGDYAGCGQALSSIDLTEARFFEGVCWLLSGHDAAGSSALRKTIDAGEPGYSEQARFYLAKSLIGRGKTAAAQTELREVAAMHGKLERQAQELLGQIR